MKKIRILSVFFVLFLCTSLFSPALAIEGADSSPEADTASAMGAILPSYTVKAESALLLELNTGLVLLEQNADEQIYPASLTKIIPKHSATSPRKVHWYLYVSIRRSDHQTASLIFLIEIKESF